MLLIIFNKNIGYFWIIKLVFNGIVILNLFWHVCDRHIDFGMDLNDLTVTKLALKKGPC